MSIFDARRLTEDADGAELLSSVVHQSKRGRARALARGRCRASLAAKGLDAWTTRPIPAEDRAAGLAGTIPA